MKLLRISAAGLPLFSGACNIDFVAQQRVSADNADEMTLLFQNGSQRYYQSNAVAFIGINASGKTTLLKLIAFAIRMLGNEPINKIAYTEILDGLEEPKQAVFDIFYLTNNHMVNRLHSVIMRKDGRLFLESEYLQTKPCAKIKSKTDIFAFEEADTLMTRDKDELFLPDDVSIVIAYNKKSKDGLLLLDMLQFTNMNELRISGDCPPAMIRFLDPCIEYLHIKKEKKDYDIQLKFYGDEEIRLTRPAQLNRYLSSGTVKGINIFFNALQTFKQGGYLIVDELENHFNQEIVSTLIRFYANKKINSKGAMILFSTHYAELLDQFDRNDNVYIVRNKGGITAESLAATLKRNDIKKSEAYQSGFLNGTTPVYETYLALKKEMLASCGEDS